MYSHNQDASGTGFQPVGSFFANHNFFHRPEACAFK
jgi:hypothetical protein